MKLRIVLIALLVLGCTPESHGPILLVPIGPVPPPLLQHLQRELPPLLGSPVSVAAPIPPPAAALDPKRRQYLGEALLEELERRYADAGANRVVGLLDADAYAPGLHFIFGQARNPGRYAVVALPRLRGSFYGRHEEPGRFLDRAVKVTVHETGHTYGYAHCPNPKCVMHFANSVLEVDRQGASFCERERRAP